MGWDVPGPCQDASRATAKGPPSTPVQLRTAVLLTLVVTHDPIRDMLSGKWTARQAIDLPKYAALSRLMPIARRVQAGAAPCNFLDGPEFSRACDSRCRFLALQRSC